jgi:hypothetical protein
LLPASCGGWNGEDEMQKILGWATTIAMGFLASCDGGGEEGSSARAGASGAETASRGGAAGAPMSGRGGAGGAGDASEGTAAGQEGTTPGSAAGNTGAAAADGGGTAGEAGQAGTADNGGAGGAIGNADDAGAIVSFTRDGETLEVLAVPGEVVVMLVSDATAAHASELIEGLGASRVAEEPQEQRFLAAVTPGTEADYIAQLDGDPRVVQVLPNVVSWDYGRATVLEGLCPQEEGDSSHAQRVMASFARASKATAACKTIRVSYEGFPRYEEYGVAEKLSEGLRASGSKFLNTSFGPRVDEIERELARWHPHDCDPSVAMKKRPCKAEAERVARDGLKAVWPARLQVVSNYCAFATSGTCDAVVALAAGNDTLKLGSVFAAITAARLTGILTSNAVIVGADATFSNVPSGAEANFDLTIGTTTVRATSYVKGRNTEALGTDYSPPAHAGTSFASPFVLGLIWRTEQEVLREINESPSYPLREPAQKEAAKEVATAEAVCMVKRAARARGGKLGEDALGTTPIVDRCCLDLNGPDRQGMEWNGTACACPKDRPVWKPAALTCTCAADQPIRFEDPALADIVRSALDRASGDVLGSEVTSITSLNAEQTLLTSFNGLECLSALTDLDLSVEWESYYDAGLPAADLAPLGTLAHLQRLNLANVFVTDIGALSNLVELTWLDLESGGVGPTRLTDVGPLAGLANLSDLNLDGQRVRDLGPLATLTNLTQLSAVGNGVVDVTALAGLTKLTALDLANNDIVDIGPLAGLTKLESLDLDEAGGGTGNRIADLSPLSALSELTTLRLQNTGVTGIGALAKLTNLTSLDLSYNQITDIGALANLGKLQDVDISNNAITDLSPLVQSGAPLTSVTAFCNPMDCQGQCANACELYWEMSLFGKGCIASAPVSGTCTCTQQLSSSSCK